MIHSIEICCPIMAAFANVSASVKQKHALDQAAEHTASIDHRAIVTEAAEWEVRRGINS